MKRQLHLLVGAVLLGSALVLFLVVPGVMGATKAHYSLGFADDYDVLANSLATGQGYRLGPQYSETMMREPGYPLLLAGLFKIFGYGIEAARLGNLLLAAATALLLWRLARRITGDERAALVAAAVFLLHPGTLVAQARGGVEIVFMFAAVGFMLLLYRALEADRWSSYALAGLALGGVVLIRSTPLLFALVLLAYLACSAPVRARLRRAAYGTVLAGAMVLVMSPWIVRNYAVSGQIVPTATVQGVAAQEGQYTCERLSFGRDFMALQMEAAQQRNRIASELGLAFKGGYYQYFHSVDAEVAFNRALLQQAFKRYLEEPVLLARCAGANMLHFWFLGKNGFATAVNVGVQLPLLVLTFAGLYLVSRRRPAALVAPVVLFMAYIIAVHLPIIAHARHSIALVPFLAIFAGVALCALWRRFAAHLALRKAGAVPA